MALSNNINRLVPGAGAVFRLRYIHSYRHILALRYRTLYEARLFRFSLLLPASLLPDTMRAVVLSGAQ
jgi:hypothetical protein